MFDHPTTFDRASLLNRFEHANPLSAYSAHPFELDGATWPTVEHYYQAQLFEGAQRDKIAQAASPELAPQLGGGIWPLKRRGWKKLRRVLMTRAVYTQAKTHTEVAEALLATGDEFLVDNSAYDHYWGIGRDQRGENMYGQVLADVRAKLQEESGKALQQEQGQ